jgi:glycosyltransferase involved in cell wall biosynthesis
MARLPEVSVLLPAFEVAPYLDAALDSLTGQTFGAFEAIVADDASRDATFAIAETWCRRDPRIRLVGNDRNLGMTENWNRALAEARAPLVFKLDADDVLEPETLAKLVAALRSDTRIRFASCRTIECDEALAPIGPFHGEAALLAAGLEPSRDIVLPGWRWFDLSFDDHQLWHSSAQMHRRSELLASGGWDATWSCASDTDLLLRLLATDRPVAHVGYVGVRYRRRGGSVSSVFAEKGWKLVEATLVTARALASGAERARRVGRLRRNWWRIHRNAERLRSDCGVWSSMPERVRSKLRPVVEALREPPLDVRVEGRLRDAAWAMTQRLRGRR